MTHYRRHDLWLVCHFLLAQNLNVNLFFEPDKESRISVDYSHFIPFTSPVLCVVARLWIVGMFEKKNQWALLDNMFIFVKPLKDLKWPNRGSQPGQMLVSVAWAGLIQADCEEAVGQVIGSYGGRHSVCAKTKTLNKFRPLFSRHDSFTQRKFLQNLIWRTFVIIVNVHINFSRWESVVKNVHINFDSFWFYFQCQWQRFSCKDRWTSRPWKSQHSKKHISRFYNAFFFAKIVSMFTCKNTLCILQIIQTMLQFLQIGTKEGTF